MALDTVTLYTVITASAGIGAALLAMLARRTPALNGATTWSAGLGLLALYFLLAVAHPELPPFIGLAVANGIAVAAMGVMHLGACQICDRTCRWWIHLLAAVAVALVIAVAFGDEVADYAWRVRLVGLVTAAQCALIVLEMGRRAPDDDVDADEMRGRHVAMVVFGAVGLLQLARLMAHTPLVDAVEPGLLSASTLSKVAALAFLAWSLAIPVVVVYIHEARARHSLRTAVSDLRQALAEVKTLRDLLPICSSCRRIRDDANQWSSLELYLETHAGVQMTHGMCPECMTRLYPELDLGR